MAQDRDRELGSQALAGALQSSFRLLQLAMLGMLIYILLTGVYVVKQHEQAVVVRLGKVVGTKADRIRKPGLHFGFPYPIDEVIRVPVQRVLSIKSETHWYRLSDGEKEAVARGEDPGPGPPALRPLIDGYTVTGDANILHSQWRLKYRVVDPERYALDFTPAGIEKLLRSALDNAVVIVSARFSADAAQRTERDRFREEVRDQVAEIIARQNLGCVVHGVDQAKDVVPPRRVQPAFDDVIRAEQEGDQRFSEAKAYRSRVISEAENEASQIVAEAEAMRQRTIERAKADAEAFRELLPQYQKNPGVIRKTLRLDTLNRVLKDVDEVIIVRQGGELRLELGRDPKIIAEESRKALEEQLGRGEDQRPEDELPPGPPPAPEPDEGGHAGHGH